MINIGNQTFSDVAHALSELRPAAEAAPEDIDVLKALAESLALNGQVEEALELYRRVMASLADAHGHTRMAELLMRSGEALQAEEHFDRASQLGGYGGDWRLRLAKDYCELADLYFFESNLESALRCHGKATQSFPGYQDSATAAQLKRHIHTTFEAVLGVIPSASEGGPTCHAAVVIWGEDYCRFFIDYCLPSLMSPGNLLELASRERLILCLYATPEAIDIIDAAESFQRLKQDVEILFIELPETLLELMRAEWIDKAARYRNTLRIVAAHHDMATRMAKQKQASVLYVIPDWMFSEGCLGRMHDIAQSGKDICVFPSLVLNRDTMIPELDDAKLRGGGDIVFTPSHLARLAVENLHPSWEQFFAGENTFQAHQFPSWMLWRFDDQGLILHAFHWSTVYVTRRGLLDYKGKRFWTHDHRLIDAMLPSDADWDRVGVCNNTAELMVIAVAEAKTDYAWAADEKMAWDLRQIVAMAQPGVDELSLSKANHLLFKERVIYNADGDKAQLIEAEARADCFVNAITEQLADVSILRA